MARCALDVGMLWLVLLPSVASSRVVQGHSVQAETTDAWAPPNLLQSPTSTWALRQPSATHIDVTSTALRQPNWMNSVQHPRSTARDGLVQMAASSGRSTDAKWQPWTSVIAKRGNLLLNVALAASLLLSGLPAHAENELAAKAAQMSSAELVDPTCFATKCSVPMTKCIGDFDCIKGLTCSAKCSGDSECTVGCFARYNSPILEDVLRCTVEEAGCIDIATQVREPDTLQNAPRPPKKLIPATPAMLEGRWYKVMGFNSRYDCFDCQTNSFTAGDLTETGATINTEGATTKVSVEYTMPRQRIFDRRVGAPPTPIKSSVEEELIFDPANPRRTARTQGRMFGLTFWENWYVIGANGPNEPEFRFIYYTGKTLESRYQGAFVYTRTPELPEQLMPAVERIAKEAGLDTAKACRIDNSCYTEQGPSDKGNEGPLRQFYTWLNDVRYTLRKYDLPELVEELAVGTAARPSPQPYQLYGSAGETSAEAGEPSAAPPATAPTTASLGTAAGEDEELGSVGYPGPAENEDQGGPRERVLSQLGGGLAGGISGAVAGALEGGEAGAQTGGIAGRVIGGVAGSSVGGIVGGTVGTVVGGVAGSFEVGSAVTENAFDGVTAGTIFAGIDGATAGGIAGGTFGTILGRVLGGNRLVRDASAALDVEELPPLEDLSPELRSRVKALRGARDDLRAKKETKGGFFSFLAKKDKKGGKKPKK